MSDQSYLVYSRDFTVDDTWSTLTWYSAWANAMLAVALIMTGRRRSWWRHKQIVTATDNDIDNIRVVDEGVARGMHRMTWEAFVLLQLASFNIQAIAQWFSVTTAGVCDVDVATMSKTCDARSAVTGFLFYLNTWVLVAFVYAYITHARTFQAAIGLRLANLGLSTTQFALYIATGATGAAVFQGFALGADIVNVLFAWSGYRHTYNRIANRLTNQIQTATGMVPATVDGDSARRSGSSVAASSAARGRTRTRNKSKSQRQDAYMPLRNV